MPKVGIEPTYPRVHDFESCASAYSATSAGKLSIPKPACGSRKMQMANFHSLNNVMPLEKDVLKGNQNIVNIWIPY